MKFGERIKQFFKVNISADSVEDNNVSANESTSPNIPESTPITDELFDNLCDLLIEGDFGAAEAFKIVEKLKGLTKKASAEAAQLKFAELLKEELLKAKPVSEVFSANMPLTAILLLGVNGVGKTTTAAKLANLFNRQYNKKSILAAADTFRAAAIDQLKIHGERLNMRVVSHKQGGDPAAVVYDALEAAQSGGADIVIADTAGRMHTRTALVEELRKIDRIVESKAKDARYLKYLVLDATTGRNAFAQAEIFHDAVALDGVILTKYDSTAKGGVVFSLASGLSLPVVYICTGENYDDIGVFDPPAFAKEFAGID